MHAKLIGLFSALLMLTACASTTSPSTPSAQSDSASGSASMSASSSATQSSSADTSGDVICDAAALGAAMQTAPSEDAELVQLADVTCEGEWAMAVAISRVTSSTTVQTIVVFQRAPEGWIQQDREGSCSAGVIPESLRAIACEAP